MILHYVYLAVLLSKVAYSKCIQPCGYNPKTARIMQIHQLHQIC